MEENLNMQPDSNEYTFPDLNITERDEEINEYNNEIEATEKIESENFTIEELENRLTIGEIVEDKHRLMLCIVNMVVRKGSFAKLKISRSKEEPWRVVIFDTEHNHDLYAPDEVCLLQSQHNMTEEHIMFFKTIYNSSVPLARAFGLMQNLAGKQPQLIITNQRQAMISTIRTVFPATHKRLCQWHINQNAPSHFGSLNTNSVSKHLWTKCMSYCDRIEEFEATWQLMVENYNIGEQKWFKMMHNLRHKWASAFSNHIFSSCIVSPPNFLLKRAAEVYIHNIFHLFQNELKDSFNFKCMEEPAYPIFSLRRFTIMSFGESTRTRVVEYDNYTSETLGILYSHILRMYTQVNLKNILERYILKRWIKNAKNRVHTKPSENASGRSDSVNMSKMAFVSHATKKIHGLAMHCTPYGEARYILIVSINNATQKINAFMLNDGNTNNEGNDNVGIEMLVRDPPAVRSRGITSVHKRKTSFRTTKGLRQSDQSSQTHGHECLSQQDVFLNSQLGANDQP
ncbi:hypothetical protein CDL12_11999 [Handroanthus impetiginosus]|uniref:MULE transposase domain-containing protein n=1 Tax=Handroanthus impetiginosus TaxID=429701 RepID=A0A2G9HCY1_9LAMI|nr:hypothetical protein CDL12_11999 [Handroanthus impetiginosus]